MFFLFRSFLFCSYCPSEGRVENMKQYTNHQFYQKNVSWLYIIILMIGTVATLYFPHEEQAKAEEAVVIPDEAIRLRILANSDSEEDQEIKREIRDAVNKEITLWVGELTSIDEARETITSNLQEIEAIVQNELAAKNINYSFQVDFDDVQFPTKLYGQYLYPAGIYEAILITLGEGEGENWWCVLFPPLCFLEFSNGLAVSPGFEGDEEEDILMNDQAEDEIDPTEEVEQVKELEQVDHIEDAPTSAYVADEEDEVEVKFFIKELFNQLF